ncbi:hypothetical protein GTX14_18595 [Streptomyces sp. SID4944]|nr:hypothetical protein [Streptomyces sp. SID4944]
MTDKDRENDATGPGGAVTSEPAPRHRRRPGAPGVARTCVTTRSGSWCPPSSWR